MGVASFLMSMWRPSTAAEVTADRLVLPASLATTTAAVAAAAAAAVSMDNSLSSSAASSPSSSPSTSPSSSSMSLPSPMQSTNRFPCSARHVAFTLPHKLYSWLEAMAVVHNYGSVHKSIRDLLAWACTGQDDDLDWLFSISDQQVSLELQLHQADSHHMMTCYPVAPAPRDVSFIAEKQSCTRSQVQQSVSLDARVSDALYHWISRVVDRYSLHGPSAVLETLCRSAIHLHAADDIFESDESGHDLPVSTAELYHDLGLIRFASPHPQPVRG